MRYLIPLIALLTALITLPSQSPALHLPIIIAPAQPIATSTPTFTPTGTATATGEPTSTPTITPTITPTATDDQPSGPCLCSSNIYNCPNFATQGQAQACFDYCQDTGHGDVHLLDTDNDGVACESLPGNFRVVR